MKSSTWSDELLDEHRDYIRENGARAAFDFLVTSAIESPRFECAPAMQGDARIFTYNDKVAGVRPFAFIVNQKSLLFYIRKPGWSAVRGGVKALKAAFDDVSENPLGEWTVRLGSRDDAQRMNAAVFSESAAGDEGIPDGITRDDILDAIRRLDAGVQHAFAASIKYDVVYQGRRYAPKAVVGLAAERLAGRQLGPYDFKGGEESKCFRVLEALGFTVSPKETASQTGVVGKPWRIDPLLAGQVLNEILAVCSTEVRIVCIRALKSSIDLAEAHFRDRWILTLNPDYVRVIAGMVMCLQFTRDGRASLLLPEAKTPANLRKDAGQYKNAPGCLEVHLSLEKFAASYSSLRMAHQSAIKVCLEYSANSGGHRRANAPGLVTYLKSVVGAADPILLTDDEVEDAVAIHQLQSRTDIGPTQKQTLVDARRGQGLFRERVIALELRCRITGVDIAAHLRASHIKPWKVATDQERLDGNNGLLIAPHIDHLFDKGFISFTDFGDLIVSPHCPQAVLVAWGISRTLNVGQFRVQQRAYLSHHRTKVLQK